jgi:predicted ester cyclase
MATDPTNFIDQLGEVWITGKVDALDDIVPADVAYHIAPFPDLDRDGLKEFVTAFHQAFPDFTLSIDDQIVAGETSAYRWNCRATYTGDSPLLPVPPTGQPTQATGSHFVRWHDGVPVEVWHHGDWLGWLQRCDVLPPLG